MTIAFAVLGIVLANAAPAVQTAPDVQPPAPRQQRFDVRPTSPSGRSRVVCGMTLVSPDDRTRYPIRELTPPPNAPRFTMRTETGECEHTADPKTFIAGPLPQFRAPTLMPPPPAR